MVQYYLNGVNITKNPTLGWYWRDGSEVMMNLSKRAGALQVPGRDGIIYTPSPYEAPVIAVRVYTPRTNFEALVSLFSDPGAYMTSQATSHTRQLDLELLSYTTKAYARETFYDVTFLMRVNGVFWRDINDLTYSIAIANPTQFVDIFPNMSGIVSDALIFLGGNFGDMTITDSNGSWIRTEPSQNWSETTRGILYSLKTGQTWISTVADPWTPFADYSRVMESSSMGGLKITTYVTPGNPTIRTGKLRLVTQSQISVVFKAKGRGAYVA